MEYTRLNNDCCATNNRLSVSTGIMNYHFDNTQNKPNNTCFLELGQFSKYTRRLPVSQVIDNESNLFGLNNRSSKCNNGKVIYSCNKPNSLNRTLSCDGKSGSAIFRQCNSSSSKKCNNNNDNNLLGFML